METLCLERGQLDGLEADLGGLGTGEREGFLGKLGGDGEKGPLEVDSSVIGFDLMVSL